MVNKETLMAVMMQNAIPMFMFRCTCLCLETGRECRCIAKIYLN